MSKKDFLFAAVTGFIAGFLAWRVLDFLGVVPVWGERESSFAWLMVIVPILWIIGVRLGYFLSRWLGFFRSFGKFAAIGFTNFAVDIAILNFFIAKTDIASGFWYSVFKGTAFLVAVTHSFFWNKYWAFEAGQSHGGRSEFGKFMSVNLAALLVNVGVASLIVSGVNPLFGLSAELWANLGAVAGSAAALVFSFLGIRLLVFKPAASSSNFS